jgi:uncharacterized delta-60 repeat protein
VVAGRAWVGNVKRGVFALARYDANGTLDNTFGGDGIVLTNFSAREDFASAAAIQADGRIIAAGTAHPGDFAIARYMPTGMLDRSFSGDGRRLVDVRGIVDTLGRFSNDRASGLALQVNGKVVVSGSSIWRGNNETQVRLVVLRLRSNGALDTSFSNDGKILKRTGMPFPVHGGVAIQPDRKIVISGTANHQFVLVRYLPDGSRDRTFSENGVQMIDVPGAEDGFQTDFGVDLAIQTDGRIVEAGSSFDHVLGDLSVALARVNSDGSIDTAFGNAGTVVTDFGERDGAASVLLQPDGKILIAGHLGTNTPFTSDFLVARYLN